MLVFPPQLPATEQARLLTVLARKRATKAQKTEARDQLISTNLRLVQSIISEYARMPADPDDLFRAGVLGLIRAIDKYPTTRVSSFAPFAARLIRNEIAEHLVKNGFAVAMKRNTATNTVRVNKAVREKTDNGQPTHTAIADTATELGMRKETVTRAVQMSNPISLDYDEVEIASGRSTEEQVETKQQTVTLLTLVSRLTANQQAVLAATMTDPAASKSKIGRELGVTSENVTVLIGQAYSRLRHPTYLSRLAS